MLILYLTYHLVNSSLSFFRQLTSKTVFLQGAVGGHLFSTPCTVHFHNLHYPYRLDLVCFVLFGTGWRTIFGVPIDIFPASTSLFRDCLILGGYFRPTLFTASSYPLDPYRFIAPFTVRVYHSQSLISCSVMLPTF